MSKTPGRMPRLHCDADLAAGGICSLTPQQVHYVLNVMRMKNADALRVFNGRDGEWRGNIEVSGRRKVEVRIADQLGLPQVLPDIDYVFAPLKSARLDLVAQKATELGARRLRPVITRRTVAPNVNLQRLRANTIEAAEQCNMIAVPQVLEPVSLEPMLSGWDEGRRVIFCDEGSEVSNPIKALAVLESGPLAVLVGPEGGFDEQERSLIRSCNFAVPISLGPRIMRADTAGIAALTLVQAALGDWKPVRGD